MKQLPFRAYSYSKNGKQRKGDVLINKRNEDYKKVDIYRGIFITADGVGGYKEGRTASRHATLLIYDDMKGIYTYIKEHRLEDKNALDILVESVHDRNKYIYAWGKIPSAYRCGTTLDGMIIHSNKIFGVHVGDGTVYKIDTKRNIITPLTTPDKGMLNGLDELTSLEKDIVDSNIVSNYIGQEKITVQSYLESMSSSDVIIMATDGFTKKVHSDEILHAFNNDNTNKNCFDAGIKNLKELCRKPKMMAVLVNGLREKGYKVSSNIFYDDTTFIAIQKGD